MKRTAFLCVLLIVTIVPLAAAQESGYRSYENEADRFRRIPT